LLEAGADPDARNTEGLTALALGAFANKPAVVELLVRAGAAVDAGNWKEGRWMTSLHRAAAAGNDEMVGVLLRCGANPSSLDSGHPFSPLEAAFVSWSASVIRLLVEAGADLEATGISGLSAPDFAEKIARQEPTFGEVAIRLRRAAGGGLF
jgi:ankyrin repeat protein